MKKNSNGKICIMSSVPGTLKAFYSVLLKKMTDLSMDFTIVSSPQPVLAEFEQQFSYKVFPVEITREISAFRDIVAIFKLVRHFRKERYDIVHAHTPKAGLVGMAAALIAGVPNRIYTIHGMPLETMTGIKRAIFRFVSKLTSRMATVNIVDGKSLRDLIAKEKICSFDNMIMFGDGTACGIDLDKFDINRKDPMAVHQMRQKFNIPDDATVIGFVGRLVPDKGVDILIKAFDIVTKQADNVYLFLIGRFQQVRQEIVDERTRRRIDNDERIIHLNYVEEIVPYYFIMDMLVLPSKREGFNYVLIEAAAAGLATVTTRATGCVDGVVDGVTGYVVDIGDYKQLADVIISLIRKPDLRKEFGKNGCERVKRLFDSNYLTAEHLRLYEKLTNTRHRMC
jgi:glycosyltransferase involved in cell wall biosynthesis